MITPEQVQQLGTTECVRYLERAMPEVHRAFQAQRAGMSYEQCLEMMVIALSNNSQHYQNECVRLMACQPVSIAITAGTQK
tara:strand:- start:240 stop:482 length:243 start_codon:yes stop_codon:yes gene_type:complete